MAIRAKKRGGEDGDNWGVQSIKGEWMNSLEEVTIANWLYVNNIEYEYEKPYPNLSANEDFRQYMPDFYYPQVDVYHEHFALDQYGNAPLFFKDGYAKEAQKKREIHMRYNTDLIETTSAMFEQGDVLETLKNQLSAKGIVFGDRRPFSEINSSIREQFIKTDLRYHTKISHPLEIQRHGRDGFGRPNKQFKRFSESANNIVYKNHDSH